MKICWIVPTKTIDLVAHGGGVLSSEQFDVVFLSIRDDILSGDGIKNKKSLYQVIMNFDLILVSIFMDSVEISPKLCARINRIRPVVLVGFDDEIFYNLQSRAFLGAVTGVITTSECFAEHCYSRALVKLLKIPLIVKLAPNDLETSPDKNLDVIFIGSSYTGERSGVMDAISRVGLEISFSWFGKGTSNGVLKPDDYWQVLNLSKISLNFLAPIKPSMVRLFCPLMRFSAQPKGRVWEAQAAGCHIVDIDDSSSESLVLEDVIQQIIKVLAIYSDDMERATLSMKAKASELLIGQRSELNEFFQKISIGDVLPMRSNGNMIDLLIGLRYQIFRCVLVLRLVMMLSRKRRSGAIHRLIRFLLS